jgi:hypothetical protein
MRWLNTKELRTTITALFTVTTAPPPTRTPEEHAASVEAIRGKMLAMAVLDDSDRSERLVRRIRYANVESLWYARGELMAQLAREHGEAIARERIEVLSEMFHGVLPRGLCSRPSPLDGTYRSSRPGEG